VARAAAWASRVIIMDEPTAALGVVQSARVLDVDPPGPYARADGHPDQPQHAGGPGGRRPRGVLRLGRRVATFTRKEATLESLVGAMTGALEQEAPG